MSPHTKGSAAALEGAPRSADEAHRRRIRRVLTRHQPDLALLAAQVGNCLPAPDPEAALVYLAELQSLCARLLTDLDR